MIKKSCQKFLLVIFLSVLFPFITEAYGNSLAPQAKDKPQDIGESISLQTDNTRTLELSPHVWDRYVRGFRRDHNLSVESGYSSTAWITDKFGDLTSEQFQSRHLMFIGQYTFHILIAGKTGYFLGSSAGYTLVSGEKLGDKFQPTTSWLLPGVQAGLVYNYDPSGRIFMGLGAQLERFNGLATKKTPGDWQKASLTGEAYQIFVGADIFLLLDTAIHFSWIDSTTFFKRPKDAEDKLVDVKMKRRSQGASIGLLYHFL